ncbi:MAG TPA: helix-turn-helix domain-containing protein [Phycisphaerae bacterium]|nr:helix-turn-helix domain-containing protein [Phycisphaerae bacterium]
MAPPEQNQLVTSDRLAEHFTVSVETVRTWVRQRRIPFLRVSRKVIRFRIAEVERALSQRAEAEAVAR